MFILNFRDWTLSTQLLSVNNAPVVSILFLGLILIALKSLLLYRHILLLKPLLFTQLFHQFLSIYSSILWWDTLVILFFRNPLNCHWLSHLTHRFHWFSIVSLVLIVWIILLWFLFSFNTLTILATLLLNILVAWNTLMLLRNIMKPVIMPLKFYLIYLIDFIIYVILNILWICFENTDSLCANLNLFF